MNSFQVYLMVHLIYLQLSSLKVLVIMGSLQLYGAF
jgi:hypothetical protein